MKALYAVIIMVVVGLPQPAQTQTAAPGTPESGLQELPEPSGDFSLDDIEPLPLPTVEEGGVQVEGKDYYGEQKPGTLAVPQVEAAAEQAAEVDTAAGSQPLQTSPFLQNSAPEIYSIVRGDTLWDVCSRFLGSPYEWPKLWALNQYITNPHLIFPGDQLRFTMGTMTSPPRLDILKEGEQLAEAAPTTPDVPNAAPPATQATQEVAQAKAQTVDEGPARFDAKYLELRNYAFISERSLRAAGHVSHSGEEKYLLATGDSVYLNLKNRKDIKVGDKLLILERERSVPKPSGFGSLGHLVVYKGVIQVTELNRRVVVGKITDSWISSHRDDLVVPFKPLVRKISLKESAKDLKGKIVTSATGTYMIGHRDIAFVNLGKRQGLEEGDQLSVVRRGDGVLGQSKKLPFVAVAKLTVVETMDNTAVVYVNWSQKALEVGDLVTTRL